MPFKSASLGLISRYCLNSLNIPFAGDRRIWRDLIYCTYDTRASAIYNALNFKAYSHFQTRIVTIGIQAYLFRKKWIIANFTRNFHFCRLNCSSIYSAVAYDYIFWCKKMITNNILKPFRHIWLNYDFLMPHDKPFACNIHHHSCIISYGFTILN